MKKELILITFALVFSVSLASAVCYNFDEDSSNLVKEYLAGDFISGILNMSFSDCENTEFKAYIDNEMFAEISLFDFLEALGFSNGVDYFCNPESCEDDYSSRDRETEKEFTGLEPGDKELIGFKLEGEDIDDIFVLRFNITSTAEASCERNQIFVDILNDDTYEFRNSKNLDEVCKQQYRGCFNEPTTEYATLGDNYYCQQINLPAAPGYRIGARVKRTSTDGTDLKMIIFNGTAVDPCEIEYEFDDDGEHEIYCKSNLVSDKTFDAYVCIRDESSTVGSFDIKTETNDPCGGESGEYPQDMEFVADYDLFAQPLKYDAPGTIEFLIDPDNNNDLLKDIEEYINDKYSGNCKDGCLIPVSLFFGEIQDVTISGAYVFYHRKGGNTNNKNIYELVKKPFTIDSNDTSLILDMDKMEFMVPDDGGIQDFVLNFENQALFEEDIDIEVSFAFNVAPRYALLGQKTTFTASTLDTIVSSSWNFGDNSSIVTTSNNYVEHIFQKEGNFVMEVSLSNDLGETSTKKFKILVGDAERSANITIKEYDLRIANLKTELNALPDWVEEQAATQINLPKMESDFTKIKNDYYSLPSGSSSDKYAKIIENLLKLNEPAGIPYALTPTVRGSLPADVGFNNIDTSHIEEISDQEAVDRNQLKLSIIGWMSKNYDITIDFETVSVIGDLGEEDILTSYKILLDPADNVESDSYLIVHFPKNSAKFKQGYNEMGISSDTGFYIPVNEDSGAMTVEFLVLGSSAPPIEALGVYISPEIDSLDSKPILPGFFRDGEGNFRWGFFLIAMAILFVITLAVYIVLQEWYKRHYESHLFKNPDDLYNIINFIYNSRAAGLRDDSIRKKLSSSSWKREQITYAFNKIDGKRTGMWEIPLFKFVENKKVRRELERKQRRPIDPRFIGMRRPLQGKNQPNQVKTIPTMVKLIAVFDWFGGIALFIGGVVLILMADAFGTLAESGGLFEIIAKYSLVGGILFLFIALINVFIGVGLWKGRNWARLLQIVFAVIGLLISIYGVMKGQYSNAVGFVLYSLIAAYLLLGKEVKKAFV